ncbi:HAD hydrolase-like protein [Geminocystis sp. GBBB08]|uniref:HAD hydrolase-like protein n=1 Tax=Geminocystis sp. GBBB08 TaxID=2604140 RepID=UPI0027E24C6B|nr:HAD hydrolase-like protein [Geminocystis sp. GBBB08]MBL1209444.1 HAD hydrolase-like protein [Geminocystis sp. GBBB08]
MIEKVLIFDFDGTLADSRLTLVKIANELADEFGYEKVTEDEMIRLSKLSSKDIFLQSPIPAYKIPFLLRRVKKELNQHIANLKPFSGIKEALINLKKQGFTHGIVTSNLENNVLDFLKNNELECYFDFIYSANTLFGKNKVINKLIKKHQLLIDTIFYVGDETRDIEAAQKSKIKVIAVTWGFNSADVLAEYNPDFLIDKPQQLSEIFNEKLMIKS